MKGGEDEAKALRESETILAQRPEPGGLSTNHKSRVRANIISRKGNAFDLRTMLRALN
jgi:hypothetical protein